MNSEHFAFFPRSRTTRFIVRRGVFSIRHLTIEPPDGCCCGRDNRSRKTMVNGGLPFYFYYLYIYLFIFIKSVLPCALETQRYVLNRETGGGKKYTHIYLRGRNVAFFFYFVDQLRETIRNSG